MWHRWFAGVTDVAGADVDVGTGLVFLGNGLLTFVPKLVEDTNLEVVHHLLHDRFDQMGVKLLVVDCGICLFVVPSSEVFVDNVRDHSGMYREVLLKLDLLILVYRHLACLSPEVPGVLVLGSLSSLGSRPGVTVVPTSDVGVAVLIW